MTENSTTFMTGNVHVTTVLSAHRSFTHTPTLSICSFIHLLPVATTADPLITYSQNPLLDTKILEISRVQAEL